MDKRHIVTTYNEAVEETDCGFLVACALETCSHPLKYICMAQTGGWSRLCACRSASSKMLSHWLHVIGIDFSISWPVSLTVAHCMLSMDGHLQHHTQLGPHLVFSQVFCSWIEDRVHGKLCCYSSSKLFHFLTNVFVPADNSAPF